MGTNKFALYNYIYDLLNNFPVPSHLKHSIVVVTSFVILLVLSFLVYYFTKYMVTRIIRKIVTHTKKKFDDAFTDPIFLRRLSLIIPLILIYKVMPYILPHYLGWTLFIQNLIKIFIVLYLVLAIFALADAIYTIYNQLENVRFQPIKGFVEVFKIIVGFLGGIVILSILLSKSPGVLIGGLGAVSAVLLLVFKDPLLGFTSSIQLTSNKMIQKGDWITIPAANIDGEVEEVTLSSVKIRNFDKTYSYYPTYSLMTTTFINNRGMYEENCRRAYRKLFIQPSSVRFVHEEDIENFKKSLPAKLQKYFTYEKDVQYTNLELFRIFLERYLQEDPRIDHNQLLMVYIKEQELLGIPFYYYFFTKTTEWKPFNMINNQITELILSTLPLFDLKIGERTSSGTN
jgi:miniconductance mechanosensitive channel